MTSIDALMDIAQAAAGLARALKPHYATLLLCHLTKDVRRIELNWLSDGTRAVVEFVPADAGEYNEINNEPQRYEVIVRPITKEKV